MSDHFSSIIFKFWSNAFAAGEGNFGPSRGGTGGGGAPGTVLNGHAEVVRGFVFFHDHRLACHALRSGGDLLALFEHLNFKKNKILGH